MFYTTLMVAYCQLKKSPLFLELRSSVISTHIDLFYQEWMNKYI